MKKADFALMEAYMKSCMDHCAHDEEHIYRVLNNALVIAEDQDGVDYDVLIAACLLHDVGRQEQLEDPALCHARIGAQKAYHFLIENGFEKDFAHRVESCIRTHRFRRSDPPESIEAKILFDADKLDVSGAIGLGRTLLYKGQISEPLYTRTSDGRISDGTGDDKHSFFQEYKYKLEKIYDNFQTVKGQKLALERRDAAAAFYQSMLNEVRSFGASGENALKEHLAD